MNFIYIMPRKMNKQVIELEDSDVESVSSDNESVINEHHTDNSDNSDNDSDTDSEEEEEKQMKAKTKKATTKKATSKKTKVSKVSEVEENEDGMFSLEQQFQIFNEDIKKLEKVEQTFTKLQEETKEKGKEFKTLYKELKKSYNLLQKEISNEWKKLEKQKRKSSGKRKEGGITKPKPVPIDLCKYLGISVDSELPRSQVTGLCYAEFKKRNLGIGNREYKFDKDTAKVFGGKKGEVFKFNGFQTILKNVYENGKYNNKTEDL